MARYSRSNIRVPNGLNAQLMLTHPIRLLRGAGGGVGGIIVNPDGGVFPAQYAYKTGERLDAHPDWAELNTLTNFVSSDENGDVVAVTAAEFWVYEENGTNLGPQAADYTVTAGQKVVNAVTDASPTTKEYLIDAVVDFGTIVVTQPPVISSTSGTLAEGTITYVASQSSTTGANITTSTWWENGIDTGLDTATPFVKDTNTAAHSVVAVDTWTLTGYTPETSTSNRIDVAAGVINVTQPPAISSTTGTNADGTITYVASQSSTDGAVITTSTWWKDGFDTGQSTATPFDKGTDPAAHSVVAVDTWTKTGYPDVSSPSNQIDVEAFDPSSTTDMVIEVVFSETTLFMLPFHDAQYDGTVDMDNGAGPVQFTANDDVAFETTYPAGTYEIRVSGKAPALRFGRDSVAAAAVTRVINAGEVQWNTGNSTFLRCTNMTEFTSGNTDWGILPGGDGTNYYAAFAHTGLVTPDLSGMTFTDVKNIQSMFSNCPELRFIDTTLIDTSKVIRADEVFWNCPKIEPMDISGWNLENLGASGGMFNFIPNDANFGPVEYDKFLRNLGNQTLKEPGIHFGFGVSEVNDPLAEAARRSLIIDQLATFTDALNDAPEIMDAPSLAVGGNSRITVTFAAQPFNNGAPIRSNDLQYSIDDGTNWTVVEDVPADANYVPLPYEITGLPADTEVLVQTRAGNFFGDGDWSPSAAATTDIAITFAVDNVGGQPVITTPTGTGGLDDEIELGLFAGTRSVRVPDNAALTVSMIETAATCGVLPVIQSESGTTDVGDVLTGTSSYWWYADNDPGDIVSVLKRDGAPVPSGLPYTILDTDDGAVMTLEDTLDGVTVTSEDFLITLPVTTAPFIFTLETTANDETVQLACVDIGDFNATIQCPTMTGDDAQLGTIKTITAFDSAGLLLAFPSPGTHTVSITGLNDGGTTGWPNMRHDNGARGSTFGPANRSIVQLGIVGWETLERMFYGCRFTQDFTVGTNDMSQATTGSFAFRGMSDANLTTMDFSGVDFSSVTTFINAFNGNDGLTSIDFRVTTTSALTGMNFMFTNCDDLTTVDVTGMDTSAVTRWDGMFSGSANLTTVIGLGALDVSAGTNFVNFMNGVTGLNPTGAGGYDELLVGWGAQSVQSGVVTTFGGSVPTATGVAGRDQLVAQGWTVTDGTGTFP